MTAIVAAPATADTHAPLSLFAGDDWSIGVTFLDAAGAPINLTGATVKWTLLNIEGQAALTSAQFSVTVGSPTTGQCTLDVPAASSTTLAGGAYNDAWRLIIGGASSTPLYRSFIVHADPFAPGAAAALGAFQGDAFQVANLVTLRSRSRIGLAA